MGRSSCHSGQRENHHRSVPLKFCTGRLDLNLCIRWPFAKSGFKGIEHGMMKARVNDVYHGCDSKLGLGFKGEMDFGHHASGRPASTQFDGVQAVVDQGAKLSQGLTLPFRQGVKGLLAHDHKLLAAGRLHFEHVASEAVDLVF